MRAAGWLSPVMACLFAACGTEAHVAPDSGGAPIDAGSRLDGASTIDAYVLPPPPVGLTYSPDGLGYCCPIDSPSCNCSDQGGFVPPGGRCLGRCDVHPADWGPALPDEHGCLRVATGRAHSCFPGSCQQGQRCTLATGCAAGECLAEVASTVGSAMDPISGLPGGGTTIERTSWVGGYCTSGLRIPVGTVGACDFAAADDVDDGCGPCGQCIDAGPDTAGVTTTLCLAACTPGATSNPCRTGYTCSFTNRGCVPGCGSDDECRVYREDTNANGAFDEGVDRLVYDAESMATCNAATGRCDQPAAPSATAGIACTRDSQCEENGECLTEIALGWPGGYCSKRGCALAGRSCAGTDSVCASVTNDDRPSSTSDPICLHACFVGQELMADRFGRSGHGLDCRTGYKCTWVWGSPMGSRDGVCEPGNYNEVTTNNIGGACAAASVGDDPDLQCYSPFGYGRCITPNMWRGTPLLPTGMCSLLDCAAPGVSDTLPCGPDAQCISAGGTLTFCLRNCTNASDCLPGYACGEVSMTPTDPHACVPNCAGDADCTADRHCLIPMGDMVGRCVPR